MNSLKRKILVTVLMLALVVGTFTGSFTQVKAAENEDINQVAKDNSIEYVETSEEPKEEPDLEPKLSLKEDVQPDTDPDSQEETNEASNEESQTDETPEGNGTYQSDVTREMCNASYWADLATDADKVLMNQEAIQKKNLTILKAKESEMNDLKSIKEDFDANAVKDNLANKALDDVKATVEKNKTYRNGEALNKETIDSWFAEMKENILNADTSDFKKKKYAICTKRADMWMAPDSELIGWGAPDDPDNEFMNASMNVNEPFIIDAITADKKFYHGSSNNCNGWVLAENFAICDNKDEWLKQWDLTNDQVLVVTTSHITLEKSNTDPDTSGVDLMLGTQLPLVAKDELPKNIGERSTWYNHVIWLPTRNADGKFVRKMGLVSFHHNVSIGYLPMTKRNILNVAFSCLGDRYGWGGMLGAMDCSMYTRSIYRCFGLELPRNTTRQKNMPTYKVDMSNMNDEERKETVSKLSPGALLMFNGHIMMYVGEVDGKQYVISDLGTVVETKESVGEGRPIQNIYCVALNSLDVRRGSGLTWLQAMSTAIVPWMDAQ